MILPDFKAFPKQGKIIGIDWGARRTGVAVSDEGRNFVFARQQIKINSESESVLDKTLDFIAEEKTVGIVIGLPLRIDGTESDTTLLVRNFAKNLAMHTDLPICFIDESLSSAEAEEYIGKRTLKNIKEKLDSESAKVILENAISLIKRI